VKPEMDAILLIADSDVRRRRELRRFFSRSGFLVAGASDGLGCLATLTALEPDILLVALDIPWGGGDGVIARLNDGLPVRRRPLVLVMGDASHAVLSARTGVAPCNCFPEPVRKEKLLDRIGMEFGIRLLHDAEDRQWLSEESMTRTLIEESSR
jgi:CheY-like chemotaxis protein